MALATALAAGCHGGAGLARLDEKTGITVVTDRAPIVFARTEARYSRSQRDYLYLGPVETNRQGLREYYLWVGVGTTIDRGYFAPPAATPQTLYVDVRGEVMELKLLPWQEREPALAHALYKTPVQLRSQLAARVTLNQLDILAHESIESVRVTSSGGSAGDTERYTRWDAAPTWPKFFGAADQ